MPRKPIIGINCDLKTDKEQSYCRLADHYYLAVEEAGGIPVLLAPLQEREDIEETLRVLDGLVLSGGNDLHPSKFGQEMGPVYKPLDPRREEYDLCLVEVALERDVPMLAICQGFQELNVVLGGDLVQDIPNQRPDSITHQEGDHGVDHAIDLVGGTRLSEILSRNESDVHSDHHQALARVGRGLVVAATAPDGIIEAVESHDHRFVLGVQFHPERCCANIRGRVFGALMESI